MGVSLTSYKRCPQIPFLLQAECMWVEVDRSRSQPCESHPTFDITLSLPLS